MGKYYCILLTTLLLFSASCEKNNPQLEITTDVDLSFKATYDGQPLVMNQQYAYSPDLDLFFSRFNFYVSDLALMTQDCATGQIELSEIEMIDFTDININAESAERGFTLKYKNVPVREYVGVRLSLGVSPSLNREEPSDFSSSHPLGSPSHYWEGWKSYIFSKVEGRADTDKDGTYDLGFAYHTGGDQAYRDLCLVKEIILTENEVGDLNIELDLKKLFVRDGEQFDIKTTPGTHTEEGLNTSVILMNNFEEAFTIQ